AKADGTEKVYTYHDWSNSGAVIIDENKTSDSEITVTMKEEAGTGTVTANYGNVSMNISGLTPNTEIKPGVSSGDLPVAVTADPEEDAYTRADVDKVIVSDAGTDIELSRDKGEWDWGNSKFSFTVPNDKAKKDDAAKLIIKMNDGNSFTCQFRIAGKESAPAVDHVVKLGKVGNGTVTATNLRTKQSSSTAVRGNTADVIFLEAEPADGFTFEKWTAVKGSGKAVSIDHYTRPEGAWFDIEDDNVNVTAHFKKNTAPGHSVTVSSDGHGIGTATPSVAYPGMKVTIKAYSEDGYKFKEWITTDKTILDDPNRATTTFTMPDHDVNVKALFKSIPKKSIKDAKVELSRSSFIYNGRIQKPIIKKIGGRLLTNGMDYSVKWSNKSSCNAGRYTLTITGEGDYTGKITATYTIKKASNTLKVSAKKKDHTVKLSELKKKSQTLQGSRLYVFTQKKRIKGDLKYSLSSVRNNGKTVKKGFAVNRKSGKLTIKKGVAKGVYNVKVKVSAEGNKNYDKATKSINFTVNVK
ncbi:MAG: hypothetical protein IKQ40_00970, partial [Lachnospiraceae bacterium]|nr:hypothetical protein [Lachnospiraceae bacterium]